MIAKLGYVVFAEDIFGKGIVPNDRSGADDGPRSRFTIKIGR